MKDTFRIVLIFALSLILLLVFAFVIQNAVGETPAATAEAEPADEAASYNELNEEGAAVITLSGDTASVTGFGAQVNGSTVTVVYPGTYRVEGTLTDGQLVVDFGDYSGAAYIILNGVSITSSTGPALQVVQADRTTVILPDGTSSSLADGADYVIEAGGETHPGAALYSADDLVIEGGGALTLTGNSADGIRVKDALTVSGGALNITALDDGVQVNDKLTVTGGSMLIGCVGDGVSVTRGGMDMSGGHLWINSSGDAVAVMTDLVMSGGAVNATACGGSGLYSYVALNDLSAKGLKADTITITGGTVDIDAADDAIHAARSAVISGGSFSLSSGDDAIHAEELVDIRNVTVDIVTCYEGVEADSVRIGNIWLRAFAGNNGIDAGEEGFIMDDGTLILTAPRIIGSAGVMSVGGSLTGVSDGTKTPLAFLTAEITGSVNVYCAAGDAPTILADAEVPASLMFVLPDDVPAETAVTLWDYTGTALYTTTTTGYGGVFLYAGAPLNPGWTYTLTAGDYTYSAVLTQGCTVTPESALTVSTSASGGPSGGPSGMPG